MEYIEPFLIGGSVIAGSKYVSTFASPALAPLIGGGEANPREIAFFTRDVDPEIVGTELGDEFERLG